MIKLRRATLGDEGLLFRWRNDPAVVQMSGTRLGVEMLEHARWMRYVLADERNWQLYIAQLPLFKQIEDARRRLCPVGMGRLERCGETAVLSYLVAPEKRGGRLAGEIIQALTVEATLLGYKSIRVNARLENTTSIRALLSAGFEFSPVELLTLEKAL